MSDIQTLSYCQIRDNPTGRCRTDFGSEDCLCRDGGVNAVGLDGDDEVTAGFEEVLGVDGDDTSLIRLGDVSKDHIDHANQHAVFQRVSGVFHDRDDVGPSLGAIHLPQ